MNLFDAFVVAMQLQNDEWTVNQIIRHAWGYEVRAYRETGREPEHVSYVNYDSWLMVQSDRVKAVERIRRQEAQEQGWHE